MNSVDFVQELWWYLVGEITMNIPHLRTWTEQPGWHSHSNIEDGPMLWLCYPVRRPYTVINGYWFSRLQLGCHLSNSPWPGIVKLFPASGSLVSDIPSRDGKTANLFCSVPKDMAQFSHERRVLHICKMSTACTHIESTLLFLFVEMVSMLLLKITCTEAENVFSSEVFTLWAVSWNI